MSDKLFSLAKQIEQIKQQSQADFSEAKEFNKNDSESISENRLLQLEQSLNSIDPKMLYLKKILIMSKIFISL